MTKLRSAVPAAAPVPPRRTRRHARPGVLLAAVSLLVAGCAPGTTGSGRIHRVGQNSQLGPGDSWIVVAQGKPTPPPPVTVGSTPPTPLPTLKPIPTDTSCAFTWLAGQVLIPVTVTVGSNSIDVSWPRVGSPAPTTYRVAAVPQDLVAGAQPPTEWKTVQATSGCSAKTQIGNLTSGAPYVVWLDAPDSGYQIDGTPRPRSGRSSVVYPT